MPVPSLMQFTLLESGLLYAVQASQIESVTALTRGSDLKENCTIRTKSGDVKNVFTPAASAVQEVIDALMPGG
jgi:hypothetical protein